MNIARLKIQGFRGANDADINLGRHTVLIGPNNSGKTTIIEACQRRSKISPPGRSKTSPLNVMRYAVLGGCPGSP